MSMTSRGTGERRQLVRDAEEREPRLLVPADDVDRKAQRALGDARRIRCAFVATRNVFVATTRTADGMQAGEALAEPREAGERGVHRGALQPALVVEPGAEAQRLAPRVELVDLVALDAADLEPEAVRSEIDDGQQRVGFAFGHAAEIGRADRRAEG